MSYYIGADLETSALKLLLIDDKKNVVKIVSESYDVYYPKAGWSEQNPMDWWKAFVSGVKKLTMDIDKSMVRGIAVAGQMHGLVILDDNDSVIRPVFYGMTEEQRKKQIILMKKSERKDCQIWLQILHLPDSLPQKFYGLKIMSLKISTEYQK